MWCISKTVKYKGIGLVALEHYHMICQTASFLRHWVSV